VDYPSLYPDVHSDPPSIPPQVPQIVSTEADVQQTTPSAASGAPPASGLGLPRSHGQEVQALVDLCLAFLDQIQRGAAPWVVQRLNRLSHIYGPMPTDPSHFSYWMAMVSIPPIDPRMQRPVRARSLIKRLTGSAHRRHGKGQTFAGEIAATPPSFSSPLDRAVE